MMEKVKQRIMNLEREVQQDEKRQKEAEERAMNRPQMEGHFEVCRAVTARMSLSGNLNHYCVLCRKRKRTLTPRKPSKKLQ